MVMFGNGGVLMMRVMFRKTAEAPRCPIPGCPFAAAMGDVLHEREREEPMDETLNEADRKIIAF